MPPEGAREYADKAMEYMVLSIYAGMSERVDYVVLPHIVSGHNKTLMLNVKVGGLESGSLSSAGGTPTGWK
jgi:hypothetical protein